MPLKINRTGVEQYAPGGNGSLHVMIIGGPGAGKTRFASYWPDPLYLNCEAGLASVADRQVPYVDISNSREMLQALDHLKMVGTQPPEKREYKTVVVDTLDAFQRKVKDEWLQQHPHEQSFRGFEAWGYLDSKMQMLMTRLLNLPLNVVVLAHYNEKQVSEGVGNDATTRTKYELQLSGAIKDAVFNDFDLVGWMGQYWKTGPEGRIEARGLTFKRTPEKEFLKDRLHVTPDWLEIRFSDEDYADLFMAYASRLDDLPNSQEVGEIADPQGDAAQSGFVLSPSEGGALPPQDPTTIPLASFDRATLAKIAKDEGVAKTVQGTPIRGNTVKSELIEAIEAARTLKRNGDAPAAAETHEAPAAQAQNAPTPAPAPQPATAPASTGVQGGQSSPEGETELTEAGVVNIRSGEVVSSEPEDIAKAALRAVKEGLGGEVIHTTEPVEKTSESPTPPAPAPAAPRPAQTAATKTCEWPTTEGGCDVDLSTQKTDYVRLSYIKARKYLCNEHFQLIKNNPALAATVKSA